MHHKNLAISENLIELLNDKIIAYEIESSESMKNMAHLIGDARIVLMGEATHGTAEFYQARMALSQYLIREKGFQAILVEGDWTSIYALHRYCQGYGKQDEPERVFNELRRFPQWMWKNTAMLKFVYELRQYNDAQATSDTKVGIFGLDLYCLTESIQAILRYLKQYHPEMEKIARERYACFDHTKSDPQLYGYQVENKVKKSCAQAVTTELLEIYQLAYRELYQTAHHQEKNFYITQNARVVKNAEHYYRSLFENHHVTWNIRDQHMADTLQNVISHLETLHHRPAKIIIWAHNSHVGDARATEMTDRYEVNLGQLVRERFNTNSFSLGFSTAVGTVAASDNWNEETKFKKIQTPLLGSYEHLFHQLKLKNFLLDLRENSSLNHLLQMPQLQRAIGVIYRPESERFSHYYLAKLPYQFDAIIHFDKTSELTPLELNANSTDYRDSDTYPAGL